MQQCSLVRCVREKMFEIPGIFATEGSFHAFETIKNIGSDT